MSQDLRLTKLQMNDVLVRVQAFRFDPAEFEWHDVEYPAFTVSRIIHSTTCYYFEFEHSAVEYSPGRDLRVRTVFKLQSWVSKLAWVTSWLENLRAEVDAPDLWAMVGKARELAGAASSLDENRPFTFEEQVDIASKLDELKMYIVTGQEFQADRLKALEGQLNYLKSASERLGRKDWLTMAYGTLVSIGLLFLPSEKATGLLHLAGTLFRSLWEHAQKMIQ